MSARVALCGLVLAVTIASPSRARTEERGYVLLQENCGACHAVGRQGGSAHAQAPPFRRIGRRVDIDGLAERLEELLQSSHRDMPGFRFSHRDAVAIRAYLHSIQE